MILLASFLMAFLLFIVLYLVVGRTARPYPAVYRNMPV